LTAPSEAFQSPAHIKNTSRSHCGAQAVDDINPTEEKKDFSTSHRGSRVSIRTARAPAIQARVQPIFILRADYSCLLIR